MCARYMKANGQIIPLPPLFYPGVEIFVTELYRVTWSCVISVSKTHAVCGILVSVPR
jgi:hypothetical protein